jgi:hypothetical protein
VQSCHQGKGWLLWRIWNLKPILICLKPISDSICVINSFDVFTIILPCRK